MFDHVNQNTCSCVMFGVNDIVDVAKIVSFTVAISEYKLSVYYPSPTHIMTVIIIPT